MPRSVNEVADEIASEFKKMRKTVATVSWDKLYEVSEVHTWRDARTEQTIDRLGDEHGLLAIAGENVIVIAKDKNFRPVPL